MFSCLSSLIRPLGLAIAASAALAAAGCGASRPRSPGTTSISTVVTSTTTPGATTATISPPRTRGPFTDASAEVKKLLALARPGTRITPQGTVPGWAPANGSAIPATPSDLSGFGFLPDRARNIQYLSFAIRDTSGRCAGGDLLANTSGTQVTSGRAIRVPDKAPCTGDEVGTLAGHR